MSTIFTSKPYIYLFSTIIFFPKKSQHFLRLKSLHKQIHELMSLVSFIKSSLSIGIRAAVQRLGVGSVVVAATALAALVYSWRERASRPRRNNTNETTITRRRRRNRSSNTNRSSNDSNLVSSSTNRASLPSWCSNIHTVTIGAKWTRAERCDLFCTPQQVDSTATTSVIMRPGVAEQLKRFAQAFDLYFIIRVDSDEAEQDIMKVLKQEGLFLPGYLDQRKIIFTETEIGRVSVARQLDPQFHIDESPSVVTDLQRFVFMVALVTENAKSISLSAIGSNVAKFTSLASVLT